MSNDCSLELIMAEIRALKVYIANLRDRVSVLETNTASWDCRIEDLEDWQEKAEDHLDLLDKEL
jgi:hypothetical protein